MTHIDYQDLLGLPYLYRGTLERDGATDCVGIGAAVFRRAGWPVNVLPEREDLFGAAIESMATDPAAHPWAEVSGVVSMYRVVGGLQFGDVVLSKRGEALHASVVVDDRTQRVISAGKAWGTFVVPANRVACVENVYRLKDRPPVK